MAYKIYKSIAPVDHYLFFRVFTQKLSSNFVSPFFGIVLKRLVSHFKYCPKYVKRNVKPMKGDNDHGKS